MISEKMKQILISVLKHSGLVLGIIAILFSTICGVIYLVNMVRPVKYQVYEEMTQLHYESTKFELVNAVDEYIKSIAKTSCLNGVVVVDKCIEHNIDVCFVLAQGQIESHFGTAGLARKTNSVWNVFAYDSQTYNDISVKGKYKSPDDSVEPYIQLLKKRYFVDGKTEYDMMKSYVDKDGNRYASATQYEVSLTNTYTNIKETTKIDSLSQELKRYAIILNY